MQKYNFTQEETVYNVRVPETTETYVAVPNKLLIDSIREKVKETGLQIRSEEFKLSKTYQVATGRIFFGDEESGLQRCLGFINSYNKSKKLGIAAGANVIVCCNGLFISDVVFMRMHTGAVLEALENMITESLSYLESNFQHAVKFKEYFRHVKLERSAISEIIGQLYLEEELITSLQLGIIKHELEASKVFDMKAEPTMWNLYNIVTESLKRSKPSIYMENHVNLHKYMLRKAHEWDLPNIPDAVIVEEKTPVLSLPVAPVLAPAPVEQFNF